MTFYLKIFPLFAVSTFALSAAAPSVHASPPEPTSKQSSGGIAWLKRQVAEEQAATLARRSRAPARWSFTAGAFGNLGIIGDAAADDSKEAFFMGWSLQAGVRRWFGVSKENASGLIATALMEYNYTRWVTAFDEHGMIDGGGEHWQTSHSIALLGRLEFAGINEDNPALGLPSVSFYPIVGFATVFGDGPGFGYGLRYGAGFSGRAKGLPIAVEVVGELNFFDEMTLGGAKLKVGISF